MSTSILGTKLYIPSRRAKLVPRARLIERLADGLRRPLTLISAPAGFGKTTLLSSWVGTCGRPVAWFSLDERDGDPVRFMTYLVAAMQTVAGDIGTGLPAMLHSPQPPSTEAMITTLLNEIGARSDSIILVLDDYHLIDSKAVDEALAFLVEHLPPQLHVVIATREDPTLPLARLRARDQLVELRAADLRFTSAEVVLFLQQVMGLTLTEQDVAILEARTEGWIVGLQLAALSMQGRDDAASFIRSFAGDHRFILDYLVSEVIEHLPDRVRGFLLETCILDRLCAGLCEAVTGRDESREMLDVLERSNLFLNPLDDTRQWYRYHHLFAEVLQTHLHGSRPGRVAALHRRASDWYEQRGERPDAIRHALAAGDMERAAGLLELVLPDLSLNRQFTLLFSWFKSLPDDLVRARPVLCTSYALTSMACGEMAGVERRLSDAERWLEATADGQRPAAMVVVDEREFQRLPGRVPLIRAGQALARGDADAALTYARRAHDNAAEDDRLTRGGAATQLALAAWTAGDLVTAERLTAEGLADLRLAGYASPAIGGAITLADIQMVLGRLRDARATYERGLEWATLQEGRVRQGAADMHVGLAALHYERNELDAAEQHLRLSQALGELAALPQNPHRWRATRACLCTARGDTDGALALLDEAERLYDGNFSPNVRPIAARRARLWAAHGRLNDALRWASDQQLAADDELSYRREFEHITLARVLLARGHDERAALAQALRLLDRLLKAAEAGSRLGSVIEILGLQAMALHAQGAGPEALAALQRALTLAEPEGYVRLFIDAGGCLEPLLREARASAILPDYTDILAAAVGAAAPKDGSPRDSHPTQVEPLSTRELEVLRLVAAGLSNQQISERLFVALDTVKGHNRRIFEKLQVRRRTEAIARARALGLI